jgi:ABC-type hemin transport system substrate-binding protein
MTINSTLTVNGVAQTLEERGSRYGSFEGHAAITQQLKETMQATSNWHKKLSYDQKEALEMIAHKIGRILNGDPDYSDSWHDIAGYASLVDARLTCEKEENYNAK